MNILKIKYQLWKKAQMERKRVAVKRHLTKSFYRKLGEAIEMCKQHPRKYYIIQKSEAEWEILGSQEVRKMRKFKEAKHDENFMKLHETAPFVSPENLSRHQHELKRYKRRWLYMWMGDTYKPLTKEEQLVLSSAAVVVKRAGYEGICESLKELIEKHEG